MVAPATDGGSSTAVDARRNKFITSLFSLHLSSNGSSPALLQQIGDLERMLASAAQAAAEREQELEQVTSLADVTQLQLDTATAEAEACLRLLPKSTRPLSVNRCCSCKMRTTAT